MPALYYSPIEDTPAPTIFMADCADLVEQPVIKAKPSTATEAAPPGVADANLQTASSNIQCKRAMTTPNAIDKKPRIVLYWYDIPY